MGLKGIVASTAGLALLLQQGIGDTIRVSLTPEPGSSRTQEVRVEVSTDHGRTYRQVLAQEYTFSPQGATFQHEDLQLDLSAITHLRLTIVPNKGGSGIATLTSLRLFA